MATDSSLWIKHSDTRYDIFNAYSSLEHAIIKGELSEKGRGGGGGRVSPLPFSIYVPSVDIDWEGKTAEEDEKGVTGEDYYVQPILLTTDESQWKTVIVHSPKDRPEHQTMTLTWDSGIVQLLEGNTPIPYGHTFTGGRSFRVKPLKTGDFEIVLEGKATANGAKAKDTVKGCVFKVSIEASNDVVCRYSTNPAGRPTVNCQARVEGAPPDGLVVTLTGKENKLRFPEVNDISKTLTLPASGAWVDFTVSGQIASTTMGDASIQARLDGANGDIIAEKDMTVLWVGISIRNTGTFSQDNNAEAKSWFPGLGMQNLTERMVHIVELVGNVSPSDFPSEIDFRRNLLDSFEGHRQPSGVKIYPPKNPPRPDPSDPEFLDKDPKPNGKIYDIDTPGIFKAPALLDTEIYQKVNFDQNTWYKNVRCSDNFKWYVILSIIKTANDFNFYNPTWPGFNNTGLGGVPFPMDFPY